MDIIDFHSHILPGADHGSRSLETSKKQLDLATKNGVCRIVATPHFYPERHHLEAFIERRDNAWSTLSSALTPESPKIAVGAEVLICDNIERLVGIEKLCIEGTRILLIELPFAFFKKEFRTSVFRLIKEGYTVVLAHADRYDPENIEMLLSAGAKIQLNASALSGISVKPHIKRWINDGYVVAIGSDIHSDDKRAYKSFVKAKKRLSKLSALDYVCSAGDSMQIKFN